MGPNGVSDQLCSRIIGFHFFGTRHRIQTCGQFLGWSPVESIRRAVSKTRIAHRSREVHPIAVTKSRSMFPFRYERTSAGIQRQLPRLDEVMLAQHENF